LVHFKAEDGSKIWQDYIEYLDDIVLDGFFNYAYCSLQYFLENTDKEKSGMPPLSEARLELQAPSIVFSPSIDQDAADSFFNLVEGLANDIFKGASLMPRLALHNGQKNYQVSLYVLLYMVPLIKSDCLIRQCSILLICHVVY